MNTFHIFNTLINMIMEKYGCFMQMYSMFIIIETIVNIKHEE